MEEWKQHGAHTRQAVTCSSFGAIKRSVTFCNNNRKVCVCVCVFFAKTHRRSFYTPNYRKQHTITRLNEWNGNEKRQIVKYAKSKHWKTTKTLNSRVAKMIMCVHKFCVYSERDVYVSLCAYRVIFSGNVYLRQTQTMTPPTRTHTHTHIRFTQDQHHQCIPLAFASPVLPRNFSFCSAAYSFS